MGIDTGCMLIVGLAPSDFPEPYASQIKENGIYDTLGEDGTLGLVCVSPYYDSSPDDRIFGISIARVDWQPIELTIDFYALIEKARVDFRAKVGAEAKVYISANVW